MKLSTYVLVLPALLLCGAPALATEVSGDQSGTWTLSQSPYELVGDVRVPPGQTLTIEPGVEVRARGHYMLTVDQGRLLAVRTATQPILMTAENQTAGWRGLRLMKADNSSVVSHCVVEYAKGTGGYPEVRGGGVYCKDCSPTISHNELRFNYSRNANANGAGGGVATESSSALILNNYIHDNEADSGGGVCCMEYGTPVVAGNRIVDNKGYYAGGGMYFGARSSPLVERNVIMGNWAGGWGGGGINSWTSFIFYGTFATVRSNLIAQNSTTTGGDARGGGGVYCRYDKCVLVNNTIADNQANQGGGIYVLNQGGSPPDLANSIVWGNTASQGAQIYLYPTTGSLVGVRYSDVEGGWGGTGNMNQKPLFVDPGQDDYHLAPLSPCIDKGDPAFTALPGEMDLDGQARVWDGDGNGVAVVDMGADEFGSFVYGDLNCDGTVNFDDIDAFVLALNGEPGYKARYPNCWHGLADCNHDGRVNFDDIDPFVALLAG